MANRIAVIGNGGGGKTTISRHLGEYWGMAIFHVDSVQYQEGWSYTPEKECDRILNEIADRERWVIDGFGSKHVIERRLRMADLIVFVDLPLYQHYLWALKRQLGSWRGSRLELPVGCTEFSFKFTVKLVKVMWEVNRDYVPWFRMLVEDLSDSTEILHLRTTRQVNDLLKKYD